MTTKIEESNKQIQWILAGIEELTKNINEIEESKLDNYNAAVFQQIKVESNLLNMAAKFVFQSHLNIVEAQPDTESNPGKKLDELLKDFKF